MIRLSLLVLALTACTYGPVPITAGFGGYGFDAHVTVVIPKKPVQIVAAVAVPNIKTPTLMVPTGTEVSDTAIASTHSGAVTVPVIEAPVYKPILAVPVK